MKKPPKKSISVETKMVEVRADDLALTVAEETINLLTEFVRGSPGEIKSKVLELYISSLISCLILEGFKNVDDTGTKNQQYQQAKTIFSDLKSSVEFAISDGFQNGLSQYANIPVGYYCLIRPIPDALNKIVM